MNNSYSGEGVEQAERQTSTPHMVSYGIRMACGCVTTVGSLKCAPGQTQALLLASNPDHWASQRVGGLLVFLNNVNK